MTRPPLLEWLAAGAGAVALLGVLAVLLTA